MTLSLDQDGIKMNGARRVLWGYSLGCQQRWPRGRARAVTTLGLIQSCLTVGQSQGPSHLGSFFLLPRQHMVQRMERGGLGVTFWVWLLTGAGYRLQTLKGTGQYM